MELDLNDIRKKAKNVDTIQFQPSSDLTSMNKAYTDYLIEVRDKSAKTPVPEDEILGKVQKLMHEPSEKSKEKKIKQ